MHRTDWALLTRRSYSVLCYHRMAGAGEPGQERIDLPPARFRRHLRVLRLLGFRPVTEPELRALHGGEPVVLGRRRYLLTADDGFTDCVEALATVRPRHAWLFVPTARPGQRAAWAGQAPLSPWPDLRELAASTGVRIGSHGQTHTPLTDVDPDSLAAELAGARADLATHGLDTDVLAYPNGQHDPAVRAAAAAAGYTLAFTTENGRNGPATDPLALRRVTPKAWDSRTSLVFRVVTGHALPARWEARRRRRHEARSVRRRRLRHRTENLAPARRLRLRLAGAAVRAASPARARVLDAGCQDGLLTRALAADDRAGLTVVGIDRDRGALDAGRTRRDAEELTNVLLAQGDLLALPFRGTFDVALAMECLAEIDDDAGAVRSLAAALRPGGRLLVHVPEATWTPVLPGSPREWRFGVRHGYSTEELRTLLEEAGLEVVRITATCHAIVQAAQELRDRYVRGRGVKMRAVALPLMAAAVRLEEAGLRPGRGRALFAEARRPATPSPPAPQPQSTPSGGSPVE